MVWSIVLAEQEWLEEAEGIGRRADRDYTLSDIQHCHVQDKCGIRPTRRSVHEALLEPIQTVSTMFRFVERDVSRARAAKQCARMWNSRERLRCILRLLRLSGGHVLGYQDEG